MEDGGFAFPTDEHPNIKRHGGMSLRDYFAGQVICGLMLDTSTADPTSSVTKAKWALAAYAIADAMLAERDRK